MYTAIKACMLCGHSVQVKVVLNNVGHPIEAIKFISIARSLFNLTPAMSTALVVQNWMIGITEHFSQGPLLYGNVTIHNIC